MVMSMLTYIIWLLAFVASVTISYFVPETTISLGGKFLFIGTWGAVLGFVLYNICKKRIEAADAQYIEDLNNFKSKQDATSGLQIIDHTPLMEEEMKVETEVPQPLPKGAVSAKEAIEKMDGEAVRVGFPLDAWKSYSRSLIKNRPFVEVLKELETLLPALFPNASGILYMYADTQSDLHKVFSFGNKVLSDDVIHPGECASYNTGDIVVSDFSKPNLSGGCTHLHHHPQGLSFCAPVEGLEEHFGILTIQTDVLPDNESENDWHAKISLVAASFGLYIATQNLNERYKSHSIRDDLTGMFNRRYMEESLAREVSAATRHNTPIGLIMLYPDAVGEIAKTRGSHAVEQLLWELGQRLPGYIRNEDIPCRFDGEVFCVILPGADLKITRQRAEKIRNEISQLKIAYGDGILSTTLSMGVSVMPAHASDASGLLYAAHESMRYAIQNGANRVILADVIASNS